MIYDVIIVGGGPAGLSAAIYTSRRAMSTLVLTRETGGQMRVTDRVENYPGVGKISGEKLAQNFLHQAQGFGAKIVSAEVVSLNSSPSELFRVKDRRGKVYQGKTIILVFGRTPKLLGVKGEKRFHNKGVSYCATCDAPLFTGKKVAVVGGGDSALKAAMILADVASQVYLIHRRGEVKAEELLIQKVKKNKKIQFILGRVKEIQGARFVEQIVLSSAAGKSSKLLVGGLFIEIGSQVQTGWLKGMVKLNRRGEIVVNRYGATSHPGIFAAGDVTDVPYQQIAISVGEAVKAALSAYTYLKGQSPSQVEKDR